MLGCSFIESFLRILISCLSTSKKEFKKRASQQTLHTGRNWFNQFQNFIFRLIISKHYGCRSRCLSKIWVKSKNIIEKLKKLRKKIINQLIVNLLPPNYLILAGWSTWQWIFFEFLTKSDYLTPLTLLDLHPQWFETDWNNSS